MKIHSFEFRSSALEWELEPMTFSDLTLLVGVSGVGKTQILNALMNLKKIAEGRSLNGASWRIEFSTVDSTNYIWSGEFELNEQYTDPTFDFMMVDETPTKERPRIIAEELRRSGDVVVLRTSDEMLLFGKTTPKLSPSASALSILSEEDAVSPASRAFNRVINDDVSTRAFRFAEFSRFQKFAEKHSSLESVKDSDYNPHVKLAIVYLRFPDTFAEIKQRFINIFPNVTDLKVEPTDEENAPIYISQSPIVQLRESGVSKWIDQFKISSGMLRTLFHLSQLYLSPNGTVILIDEFENSLGVNCIDVVTEDLLAKGRDLQFIITSHHPYIINSVGPQYWKVVRRTAGKVRTQDAAELGLADSSHQAFIQLINRDEFREGIDAV